MSAFAAIVRAVSVVLVTPGESRAPEPELPPQQRARAAYRPTEPLGARGVGSGTKVTDGPPRPDWRHAAASWAPFLVIVAAYSIGSLLLGPVVGWRGLVFGTAASIFSAAFGGILVLSA